MSFLPPRRRTQYCPFPKNRKGGGGLGPQAQRFCGPGGGRAQPKWISDPARQHYSLALLRFMNFVGQNVGEIRNDDPSGQQR